MQSSNDSDTEKASVVTSNSLGRTTTLLNEVNKLFVSFSENAQLPVLDIGCAFGVAAHAALEKGATVIANDVDQIHLDHVESEVPEEHRDRLKTILGAFPSELEFDENSLSAVHASNLLNFLKGSDIELGAAKIYRWLAPGGKLFIISGTPYANNISGFIDEYESRKASGVYWPGECHELKKISNDATISELPDFLHLLDGEVLQRTFEGAGFLVEKAEMFHRLNTPDYINFDGRENVQLIARKPVE